MSEYHKIETLYMRDEKTHRLVEPLVLKNRIYGCLKSWNWTEKIDGTNIRLIWKDGALTIGGRTDNAQIHADLIKWIYANVRADALAATFDELAHVVLYGEGYGSGIQKGGGNYSPEKKVILFDVKLIDGDGKGWWLSDENVRDIGAKIGLDVVPSFGEMTLESATELVRGGIASRIAIVHGTPAEGLIGRPMEALFDKKGHRLIVKLKTKDFAPVLDRKFYRTAPENAVERIDAVLGAVPSGEASGPQCVHGHKGRVVGCVSCVLLFDNRVVPGGEDSGQQ